MATKTEKGESTTPATGRANGGREHLAEPVGAGLRKHREEAGMSLRALAREVGVSPSLISQIEHGKATPSVATLYAIVSELGISLDELFFDNPRGAAAISDPEPDRHADSGDERTPSSHWKAPSEGPVLRAGNRLSLTLATGVRWERLTASHDPGVEFLYCTYPVGDNYYELEAGDSIAFDSRTPHRIWNLSDDKPMIAIWTVVGRDGDPRVG